MARWKNGCGLRPDLTAGRRARLVLLAMTVAAAAAVWAGSDPAAGGRPALVMIERIEGDLALIELPGGELVGLPISVLPAGAVEGESLELSLQANPAAGAERRRRIEELLRGLAS